MSRRDLEGTVNLAFFTVQRAGQFSRLFDQLYDECARVEREHRAMGQRFLAGVAPRPRYALSVQATAKYYTAKILSERIAPPRTWSAFHGFRRDWQIGQALREEILKREGGRAALKRSEAFLAIDYAGDIALKS